jgi:hypothetical protein
MHMEMQERCDRKVSTILYLISSDTETYVVKRNRDHVCTTYDEIYLQTSSSGARALRIRLELSSLHTVVHSSLLRIHHP